MGRSDWGRRGTKSGPVTRKVKGNGIPDGRGPTAVWKDDMFNKKKATKSTATTSSGSALKRLAVVLAIGAAPLAATGAASATTRTCDAGDICIYETDAFGGGLYATPVLSLDHDGLWFTSAVPVRDHANSVWNRTYCRIRVVDDRGWYPDDWQDVNAGARVVLISSVDNKNDRHERNC